VNVVNIWPVSLVVCVVIIYACWLQIRSRSSAPQVERDQLIEPRKFGFRWHELPVLFFLGASLGAFFFSGALGTYLSSPERPTVPDPSLGYVFPINAKYGKVYGTHLEYLLVSFGPWVAFAMCAGGGALTRLLNINTRSHAFPLQICAAAILSLVICFAFWKLSLRFAPVGR
jgi:hypothetical protein